MKNMKNNTAAAAKKKEKNKISPEIQTQAYKYRCPLSLFCGMSLKIPPLNGQNWEKSDTRNSKSTICLVGYLLN